MTLDELTIRFTSMTHRQKAVTVFTYTISPPTIFAGLGFAVAWLADNHWLEWGLAYNVLIVLLPLIFVGILMRLDRIQSVSMSRDERHVPYLLTFITTMATWWILRTASAPPLLLSLCLVTAIALLGLFIVNLWWKISNHATASMSAAVLWGMIDNWAAGVSLMMLAVLVCAGRLYLRKHTVLQLVAGAVWGAMVVLLIWAFGWLPTL